VIQPPPGLPTFNHSFKHSVWLATKVPAQTVALI
jgi:hypothetical protein